MFVQRFEQISNFRYYFVLFLMFSVCVQEGKTPYVFFLIRFSVCVQEGKTAYVLFLMAIYWVTESLPIAVTSLLPIFLFPMMDIISAKEIAKSYMKVSRATLKPELRAVWRKTWTSWVPFLNSPYGLCGRKATLTRNRIT